MIAKIYYDKVLRSLVNDYQSLRELGNGSHMLLFSKVALNNLVEQFLNIEDLNDKLITDMLSCSYRDSYICHMIRSGRYLRNLTALTPQDLLRIDRMLVQCNQPSLGLALNLLSLLDYAIEKQVLGLQLLKMSLRFWKSQSLITVGSLKQQAFVTYLVYELLKSVPKDKLEDEELLCSIRDGIQLRIEKVQTEPQIY